MNFPNLPDNPTETQKALFSGIILKNKVSQADLNTSKRYFALPPWGRMGVQLAHRSINLLLTAFYGLVALAGAMSLYVGWPHPFLMDLVWFYVALTGLIACKGSLTSVLLGPLPIRKVVGLISDLEEAFK